MFAATAAGASPSSAPSSAAAPSSSSAIAYHGLAFAPAPPYIAGEEEVLEARLMKEHQRHEKARQDEDRRHVEEVRRLEAELAAVKRRRDAQ